MLTGLALTLALSAAHAGRPAQGTVYIGAAFGMHHVYAVDYSYDGADSFVIDKPVIVLTLPTAADAIFVPGNALVLAGQGSVAYRVDLASATFESVSTSNNGNTATLAPDGRSVWIGWMDTCLSEVPLDSFATGTSTCTTGDDSAITMIAFAPGHGAFYTTGGPGVPGHFGRIDLGTFVTERLTVGAVNATGITYDPFSASLIHASDGTMTQIDPADPTAILGSRDDRATGENYLLARPDGIGHLFATRWSASGENRLVFLDYSDSGRIDDPATKLFSVPMPAGLSGGVAVFPDGLFRSGFDPRAH